MPTHEEHCKDSLRKYGKRFDALHRWMDEPWEVLGKKHRMYRHDPETTPKQARELFGEYADQACLDHIILDSRSKRKWGKRLFAWHKINRYIEKCKKLTSFTDRLTCLLKLRDETNRDGMVAYAIGEEYAREGLLKETIEFYEEAERRFPLDPYKERARHAIAEVRLKDQMLEKTYRLIEKEKTFDYLGKITDILVRATNAYSDFNAKLRNWALLPNKQTLRSLPLEEKERLKRELNEKVKEGELSIDAPLSLAGATTEEMDKLRMEATNLEVPKEFREMHFHILVTLSNGVISIDYFEEALRRGNHSILDQSLKHSKAFVQGTTRTVNLLQEATNQLLMGKAESEMELATLEEWTMRLIKVYSRVIQEGKEPSTIAKLDRQIMNLIRAREQMLKKMPKMMVLRFVQDIPAIIGSDMKTYGPFKREDVASLPFENAKFLIKQGIAVKVEVMP